MLAVRGSLNVRSIVENLPVAELKYVGTPGALSKIILLASKIDTIILPLRLGFSGLHTGLCALKC